MHNTVTRCQMASIMCLNIFNVYDIWIKSKKMCVFQFIHVLHKYIMSAVVYCLTVYYFWYQLTWVVPEQTGR